MTDSIGIDMSKIIEDEADSADIGCNRMAFFLHFQKMKADTVVVCADAVIASNGNKPIDEKVFVFVLTQCLTSNFFLKKKAYRYEEILDFLDNLRRFDVFEKRTASRLLSFHEGLNTNLLIKDCLCSCKKLISEEQGKFDEWLAHICQNYKDIVESDKYKRIMEETGK